MIVYGERMVNDRFDGSNGFAIDGGIKDSMCGRRPLHHPILMTLIRHIRRLTTELNCPMPAVDVAHQRLITARSIHQEQKLAGTHKWDIMDWSALIAGSRVATGMHPFDSNQVCYLLSRNIPGVDYSVTPTRVPMSSWMIDFEKLYQLIIPT